MRHEMTNLENAFIQWFPNCIQLEVSGSGQNLPATEELVAFPGAYDNVSQCIKIYRDPDFFRLLILPYP